MMSYGGVRIGLGSIGDASSDAAAAAAGAATGAIVALPDGVKLARVITSDPAPSGDLIIRTAAREGASLIPGGGAEKDGIVAVLNDDVLGDGVWAEVIWPGGARRPDGRGFAHKRFLSFLPAGDPSAPPVGPPGVSPSSAGLSTTAKVGIGLGVAAALGVAWWALK